MRRLEFGVGKAFRDVDALLAETDRATSPLLPVLFFERGQDWVEKLRGLREQIAARDVLLQELQAGDATWETAALKPTGVWLRLWRLRSFYDR